MKESFAERLNFRESGARVCVWVAIWGHQADIIPAMGLPAIEMLNDAQLKGCHIGIGNGRGNWNNRRNDGSGGRMRKHPEAEEKMTQNPRNNPTVEGIAEEAQLL